MGYIAHKSQDGRVQSVRDHLLNVSRLAGKFASAFDAEAFGRFAGLLHDIGKYSDDFQRRIGGSNVHVDHSTAGAYEAWCRKLLSLAFVISGHHGGLLDGGYKFDDVGAGTLFARVVKAESGKLADYSTWLNERLFDDFDIEDKRLDKFDFMMFVRMVTSCLVDADFIDTEAFMRGKCRSFDNGLSMSCLCDRFRQYVSRKDGQSEIDCVRREILYNCLSKSSLPKGLFGLDVPTGGGKTLSSLGFALNHADVYGMRRVIYVVPYMSIIEQNAEVLRVVLGDDNVLEHHSGAILEGDMELFAENWDVPVVITTAVQFFESLFSNRVSRCRKLHNIADSVVVFDEIQSLPVGYLRPCVRAIESLVTYFNVSAVLCTATQPNLEQFFSKELVITDLCSGYDRSVFDRVTFDYVHDKLTEVGLAQELQAYNQVLCVLNSRAGVRKVAEHLPVDGTYCLTTLICPEHRKKILQEVKDRLDNGQTCRLISTSLIEAGVDIDFPAVFRELIGFDSIVQSAGRCNRHRLRSKDDSIVTVFEGDWPVPRQLGVNVSAARQVLLRNSCNVSDYFDELYGLKGSGSLDVDGILELCDHECFPFKTISDRFHMIGAETVTVFVPYGRGRDYIECMRAGEFSKDLFRHVGCYGVTLYRNQLQDLLQSGDIICLNDSVYILENDDLYFDNYGLSLKSDCSKLYFI